MIRTQMLDDARERLGRFAETLSVNRHYMTGQTCREIQSALNTVLASSIPEPEAVTLRRARDALQAMMDAWLDYHDSHSLTQPVTGASANAFEKALQARDEIDAALTNVSSRATR